ncbi:MAG: hypothetical protein ABJM18_06850 [Hyphomonas sp.]
MIFKSFAVFTFTFCCLVLATGFLAEQPGSPAPQGVQLIQANLT